MAMNSVPNHKTLPSDTGEVSVRVPVILSSIMRSRQTHRPATRVMARSGTSVAVSEPGEKSVAIIKFLANIAIVVSRHSAVVLATIPVAWALAASSATVALLFTKPPKSAPR